MVTVINSYDFCLLHAQFYYVIVYIRKAESRVYIAERYSLYVYAEDYKIFCMTDEGHIPFIQCRISLRWNKSMRKVDSLSFVSIDSYVPAFKVRPKRTEISLQLSENIDPFRSVAYIQVSSAKRPRQTWDVWDVSLTHILHNMTDRRNLVAPLLAYSLAQILHLRQRLWIFSEKEKSYYVWFGRKRMQLSLCFTNQELCHENA
jgi:hypothetical protein